MTEKQEITVTVNVKAADLKKAKLASTRIIKRGKAGRDDAYTVGDVFRSARYDKNGEKIDNLVFKQWRNKHFAGLDPRQTSYYIFCADNKPEIEEFCAKYTTFKSCNSPERLQKCLKSWEKHGKLSVTGDDGIKRPVLKAPAVETPADDAGDAGGDNTQNAGKASFAKKITHLTALLDWFQNDLAENATYTDADLDALNKALARAVKIKRDVGTIADANSNAKAA